jgi:colanic acid/amylovoran biosynthesis glycosyltransferase
MKINIVLNRLPSVSETFIVNWVKKLSLDVHVNLIPVETYENFIVRDNGYLGKVKIFGKFNFFVWLKAILLFLKYLNFKRAYRIAHLTIGSPDLIHFSYTALAVSRIEELKKIKELGKIRTIVSCRGTSENVKPFIFRKRGKVLEELFKTIDLVHCVSENLRQSMNNNFGLLIDKSFVNRPAIDILKFPFCNLEFKKDETISILSIGRLNYIKGYFFAIEAMSKLKNLGVKFKYNIIGDGPLYEEMLFYRHQFDLVDEVNLLGIKEGEDVVSELKNSNVLLLPSLSEGIANVVLEAMAVGVFVISTNVGGMNEVIVNEETGLVINSYSSSEIVDAILWIGENPNRFNPIKEAARLKIEKDFSIERQILVFNGEYQKLIGNV